ncbi:TonB family protein [Methylophilus sp. QUAN]|uniref:TonB family protein n=1 Tax=Methylophilus sp. QUAN TaxID=2781020 RepID=UPI0018901F9A|nr:TonB family protein [Methylophilus sp. QUAN]MBF4990187.1 TonB family protein [Methylophilus sp. QUAN]
MSSLIYPEQQDYSLVWRAVIVSLALHVLVVAVYPTLSQIQLPKMPERLEIEFFSIKAAPPTTQVTPPAETVAPVEPPKATPTPVVKPQTPTETPKQVLAAPSSHESDYKVPEQVAPAKAEPAPVNPAPSVSAAESAQHATNDAPAKDAKPSVAASTAQASNDTDELNASDTDAWGDYGEQLRDLVSKSKQYPAIAIRRHLEGEASVVAQFVRGELVSVSLAGSSKHVPLDEEAMRMVKKAIAQLGVKDSLRKKSFKITIPVNFKLE